MNTEIKEFITNNNSLVHIKDYQDGEFEGLKVVKPSRLSMHMQNWDSILMDLRGTVLDKDYNVLSLPFRKSFNRLEHQNWDFNRDDVVVYSKKLNGFMAAVTYIPSIGRPVVNTTGTLDSQFVNYADSMLPLETFMFITQISLEIISNGYCVPTFIFEIVHPEDPHIIEEECGAYLLGVRSTSWGDRDAQHNGIKQQEALDEIANHMGVKRPLYSTSRWSDLVIKAQTDLGEGFMAHDMHKNFAVKLKTPFYQVCKSLCRRNELITVNTRSRILGSSPYLYQQAVQYIVGTIGSEKFLNKTEQERLALLRPYIIEEINSVKPTELQ